MVREKEGKCQSGELEQDLPPGLTSRYCQILLLFLTRVLNGNRRKGGKAPGEEDCER